ncbi:hypothetical protein [Shewanella sp. UCD-KL12]|uniref:hypothetical protein n=1 Tax=Shewanella sp. UCD-KL12 TaxID=1917163 RepID=UPI000970F7BF|nr:hypothetical protein [Shewanella sp. UCD-KL12]
MGIVGSVKLQYKIGKVSGWIEDYIHNSLDIHPRVFGLVTVDTVSNYIASSAREYIEEAYSANVEKEPFIHVCMCNAVCSVGSRRDDVQNIMIFVVKVAAAKCPLLQPFIESVPKSKSTSII